MLSAFVRLRGEKTCFYARCGVDSETGETVTAFAVNACEAADHGIILSHRSVFFSGIRNCTKRQSRNRAFRCGVGAPLFGQHKRCLFIRRYSRTRQISIGLLKNIRSAWYNICSVPQRALRGCNIDGSVIAIDCRRAKLSCRQYVRTVGA